MYRFCPMIPSTVTHKLWTNDCPQTTYDWQVPITAFIPSPPPKKNKWMLLSGVMSLGLKLMSVA